MRRLLFAALLLVSVLALGQDRNRRTVGRNGTTGPGIVLSFLPSGSWTLSDDCAGVALTGLTFSRSSSAMCTKRDGTMVFLTANKPRLQGEGLLMETGSTNLAIRSEAFDDVAWTKTNVTVTANSTVSPDGATTGDTLQSTVNGGLVESTMAVIAGGVTWGAASVYLRTTAGTQAFALALRDTTAGADRCTATGTATTTWTRFYCASRTVVGGNSHSLRIYPGGTGSTGTVVGWGAQTEAATNAVGASSYIPTAGTSVARTADFGTMVWAPSPSQSVNVSATLTRFNDATVSAFAIGFAGDYRVCTLGQNNLSATLLLGPIQRDSGGYKFATTYAEAAWTDGTTRKLVVMYTEATKNSVMNIYNGGGSLLGTGTGTAMAESLNNATQLQFPCVSSASLATTIKDVCVGTGTFCQ